MSALRYNTLREEANKKGLDLIQPHLFGTYEVTDGMVTVFKARTLKEIKTYLKTKETKCSDSR